MFRPGFAGRVLGASTLAFAGAVGLLVAACAMPSQVCAAEATRVVTAGEPQNPYDLNVSLVFRRDTRKATLLREANTSLGTVDFVEDQIFRQSRNALDLRLDVGVLPDIGVFVALPFILSDDRSLSYDDTDSGTSTLLRDGILPGFGQNSFGLDADHNRPFVSPSGRTFAGPTRSGLEYLVFGLNWAMFNERKIASEPTWIMGVEARIDVSRAMRFDPARPTANTGVGPGFHQLLASTMVSRRFGNLEPYVGGWYMYPIKTSGSPFERQGLGSNAFANPQHQAKVIAGFEATVWEQPADQQAISLELRVHMENRFLGLARSELWEPLSGSASCSRDPAACRAGLDDRDLDGDGKLDPNSGITRSPSYGIFGSDVGLNVRAGTHVRFRGLFGATAEQSRFMTDGRSGYALFDSPGRRFYVKDAYGFHLFLDGMLLF